MKFFSTLLIFIFFFQITYSQQNGPYKEHYDSGQLKVEGEYLYKKRIGKWKSYFENGQISREYSYDDTGKRNKETRSFYESGAVKYKVEIEEDEYIGSNYYETGELKSKAQIKDGFYKEFLKDGTLKIEANRLDYDLSGSWKRYYNNGKTEWIVNYKEGYRSGDYKNYYETGKLKIEGELKEDKIDGEELRYNKDGILEWKGYNNAGRFNKTWTKYDIEGNKVEKIKYKDGKLLSGKSEIVAVEVPDGVFEKVPLYPGCEIVYGNRARKKCMSEKIARFINKKFNTDLALKVNAYGLHKIKVSFKIDKAGSVTDIEAITPILVFEMEAKRIINLLPKMEPGIQFGKKVIVPYSLPIVFQVAK